MWPFDQLRQRIYKRRYNAALVVLLSTHMLAHLSTEQRKQVESEVNANMNRSDTPAVAWRRNLGASDLMAAFRAAAMERAGIAPPVAGLSWEQLFGPWNFWRVRTLWPALRGFDMLPINLINDFRPMHQATADARAFLRHNGIDGPEFGYLDSMRAQPSPVGTARSDSRAA